MQKFKAFIIGIFCILIPGCSNNNIEDYKDRKTKIDLRKFFKGEIEGWGAIFDYSGKQTRSFSVKLIGTWENADKGKLEEWFVFDDGEKTERIWDITYSNQQVFIGRAKDIIGDAKGTQSGNAVNLHYTLQVPYKDSTIDLTMDDWMYLVDENIILNRTSMNKFGFKVGEIVLFMKKK
jgi:hypothetical protein